MATDKLITIDDSTFASQVEGSNIPVLVDFGATWCGPCKALHATLEGMMDGYDGKVKFCYVDIEKAPQTAQRFAIRSVPTIVVFKNGAPAGSLLGAQPKGKLDQLLEKVL